MAKLRAIDLIYDQDRRMEALRERAKAGKCIYCGQKKGIQAEGFTCPFNLWPDGCAEYLRRKALDSSQEGRCPGPWRDMCAVAGLAAMIALVMFVIQVLGILVAW